MEMVHCYSLGDDQNISGMFFHVVYVPHNVDCLHKAASKEIPERYPSVGENIVICVECFFHM